MKKMVCEICNSLKIRKTGDIFICQECGTEYDLDSARNLLKEVEQSDDSGTNNEVLETENNINVVIKNDDNKYTLLKQLKTWYEIIDGFKDVDIWIHELRMKNNFCSLTSKFDEFKETISVSKKSDNIPLIEKKWFIRSLDFSRNDEDIRKGAEICNLYHDQKDPVNLFRNNFFVRNCDSIFWDASHQKHYMNGQGPFFKHFFAVSASATRGYAWGEMEGNYDAWFQFASESQPYYSYKYEVKKGLLFEKRITYDNEKTINASDFKKRVNELYKQICEMHKLTVEFYYSNFDNMKKYYLELCDKAYEIEKIFNLPMKYRTTQYIAMLITYIYDGRVDSWKEAVNLLEQEIYQNNVLKSLNNIDSTLMNIDKTLTRGFENLNFSLMNISSNVSQINNNINKCTESLHKIQKDTRFNLIWNL